MEASAGTARTRVLGLGNDLLADDALGVLVARELRRRHGASLDVIDTIETGFGLLDHLLDCDRMVVVDAIRTGVDPPGTVSVLGEGDVEAVPGSSPHTVGLFETLEAGRAMGLPVPRELVIIAVEAHDCTTVGGPMHPAVEGALGRVTSLVEGLVFPQCTS
jgi:hydrogenase maturation protease